MANYPGFLTLADSSAASESGVQSSRATNGALRTRRLYSSDKYVFKVGHMLSAVDRAAHKAFYDANKDLDVTYTWPGTGEVFTVRFDAAPQYLRRGDWFETRVALSEV